MRIPILYLGFALSLTACLAADTASKCVNGAVRKGKRCVFENAASTPDGGEPDGQTPGSEPGGACQGNEQCDATAPVCSEGTCAACTRAADCARFGDTPACGSSGACVACTNSADCTDPTQPVCDADNRCTGPCTSDTDCAREGLANWATPYCEPTSGACVACLPGALEEAQCTNGRACHPETFTCTGELRGSIGTCGRVITPGDKRIVRCISDTECVMGHYCVPTKFAGMQYGNYCLQTAGDVPCRAPWPRTQSATSVSGFTGEFCFPREPLTTCEAIISFATECVNDEDCGRDNTDDGHCEGGRCTYACSGDADCQVSLCVAFSSSRYCDPR